MRIRVRIDSPDGPSTTVETTGPSIRLGRGAECEVAIDAMAFPQVSGVHARIEAMPDGFSIVHLSRNNRTLLNDTPIEESAPVRRGDRVRLGYTGPMIVILRIEATGPRDLERTVAADDRHRALLAGSARSVRFEVGAGGVIGRDAKAARFHLDHPHVSRLHAGLALDGDRVILADLGSSNGTFLNGDRVTRPIALAAGDRIDIGPFSLEFDGLELFSRTRSNNIELAAFGLNRTVLDRATGKPLALLNDIGLVVRPREFLCLLGPSGSGKSTLLAILSGRNPPNAGTVRINSEDLYANFEAIKEDIAVVPQRDVLHDALGLGEALGYTAELRLPRDLSRAELEANVSDILEVVDLSRHRGTLIRHLSGGQVKRASLANELVARPSLLFLDEVTSGLDEQTDREVMELFRRVADAGKTVVCITHSLANVEATCHLVAILTEGGWLAFVGTPKEARSYFRIPRLGEVYRVLAQSEPREWSERFRASPYFRRYVADRLPALPERGAAQSGRSRRRAGSLRQAWVLTRRYVSIWRGDRNALMAMLAQCLVVAVLLGLVFGDLGRVSDPGSRLTRTMNLLLLLGVSCYWLGCNTAAKELIKERVIFLRERDFNLRIVAYYLSKIVVLTMIGTTQALLLFCIVRVWCGLPGSATTQGLVLVTLAASGTTMGLLISALATSEEVAAALVPMAVVPQIILSGVIAPLEGLALWIARAAMTVHWALKALQRALPETDRSLLGLQTDDWFQPMIVVLAHAVIAAIATSAVLSRGDRNGRR